VDLGTLLTPLIVALVPLLTMLGKRYLPARYKVMVLGLAVSLGPVLDYLSTWLSQQPASPGRGVLLGMAGVARREVIDQVRKRPSAPASTSIVPRSIEAPVLLLAVALAVTGCAGARLPADPSKMTAEQLREMVKDKAATLGCATVQTPYKGNTVLLNLDAGVLKVGRVTVKSDCEITIENDKPPKGPTP